MALHFEEAGEAIARSAMRSWPLQRHIRAGLGAVLAMLEALIKTVY